MKIYTKTGDKGKTALFGGKRVSKDDIQIEAYGTVDELNSNLGLLLVQLEEKHSKSTLQRTQSILFDIGSHLASDGTANKFLPAFDESSINHLEQEIDRMTAELEPLKSFILPGGTLAASTTHICRTICRRAERRVVSLSDAQEINSYIVVYLNRLSDYLFVLSRKLLQLEGVDEIKWNAK